MTNTTLISNNSPLKQNKRVIPDSLVKLSKFSINQQRASSSNGHPPNPIKVNNYSIVSRRDKEAH
jgi:hypothetical protein